MSPTLKSRLVGVGFAIGGVLSYLFSLGMALSSGYFSPFLLVIGPVLVGLGAHHIVFAPPIPVQKPSAGAWALSGVGILVGLISWAALRF